MDKFSSLCFNEQNKEIIEFDTTVQNESNSLSKGEPSRLPHLNHQTITKITITKITITKHLN